MAASVGAGQLSFHRIHRSKFSRKTNISSLGAENLTSGFSLKGLEIALLFSPLKQFFATFENICWIAQMNFSGTFGVKNPPPTHPRAACGYVTVGTVSTDRSR